MATIMQKDVLIEYVAGTMIDIRKIGTEKDRMKLKILRSAIYSVTAEKINFEKTADRIKKIREKYELDSVGKGRNMLSIDNTVKLKELKLFEKVAFEFHNGWTDLIYELGKDITELCELTNCELPIIQQVKTKFGTLRFYYNTLNSQYPEIIKKSIRALVSIAEIKSAEICEYCGKYGELRTTGLWFTACDEHKGNSITEKKYKELIAKKEAEKLAPEYSI